MTKLPLMLLLLRLAGGLAETPYHYIDQVPETKPQILTPKPLFSPHDPRGEGTRLRGVHSYNGGIINNQNNLPAPTYRYGTDHHYSSGSPGYNVIYGDTLNNLYGDQRLWYPIYADVQYPGWLGVSQVPHELSYGALPEGYEPKIPLRGDPTGYSFSYTAGDHSRHQSSDGRGNFYSSFSFIPPDGGAGLPSGRNPSTLDYGIIPTVHTGTVNIPPLNSRHIPSNSDQNIFSTARTPTVSISPLNSGPYSTVNQIFDSRSPSTVRHFSPSSTYRPFDTPTARPLVSSIQDPANRDFTNGFYFSSAHSARNPKTVFNDNSHALSTNIQYDSFAGESSSQATIDNSSSKRVRINRPESTPRVTTERSYQTLSRSLPLAFESRKLPTESSSFSSRFTTNKPFSSPSIRRFTTERYSGSDETARFTSRRSTTERSISYSPRRSYSSTTVNIQDFSTTKKPSFVQKIPRKPKNKNSSHDESTRPLFIDDLTSLAYSTDNVGPRNSTIIQIKPRGGQVLQTNVSNAKQKTSIHDKSLSELDYLKNSSRTFDNISKDGHVTGNKTYLAGLGLRSNIHY